MATLPARPQQRLRALVTYATLILVGGIVVLLVLPAGDHITPAPRARRPRR